MVQPHGPIAVQADGSYAAQLLLRASSRESDRNGRVYTITVKAKDKVGNLGSAHTFVKVPPRRHEEHED
jgi:hypothetical protein